MMIVMISVFRCEFCVIVVWGMCVLLVLLFCVLMFFFMFFSVQSSQSLVLADHSYALSSHVVG